MPFSADQIERVARLARLAVSDEERASLAEQLNRMIGLIDELQSVDTQSVEPMSHALEALLPQGQRLREDVVTEPDRRADFQAVAPAVEQGLYLVPRVIE